ncbi:MAG TPA: universal stress protein [Mycobacteriales bacterium]|nr:universal stress protein [Mycobacteriales bacterium]
MAQSRATQRRLNTGRSVASVRRAQSLANPTVRTRSGVIAAYFEDGAGRAALRIATEGAALRGASLRLFDDIDAADAAEELVRRSREVDLLVIGTTGSGSSDTLRVDAIARSLSHRADCPVMFVPAGAEQVGITEVVCGVDRSTGSAAALRWAAREAAMRGGKVLAQQVQPWADAFVEPPTQSLSGWVFAQEIAEPTTIVCHLVCGTSPAAELVHTALERRAMLVVGSHRSDGGQLHRCIAGRLAGRTSVPLVVVPPVIPAPRKPPGI